MNKNRAPSGVVRQRPKLAKKQIAPKMRALLRMMKSDGVLSINGRAPEEGLDLDALAGTDQWVLSSTNDHPFWFDHMVAGDAAALVSFPISMIHIFVAV
jgi:hypothetical protein